MQHILVPSFSSLPIFWACLTQSLLLSLIRVGLKNSSFFSALAIWICSLSPPLKLASLYSTVCSRRRRREGYHISSSFSGDATVPQRRGVLQYYYINVALSILTAARSFQKIFFSNSKINFMPAFQDWYVGLLFLNNIETKSQEMHVFVVLLGCHLHKWNGIFAFVTLASTFSPRASRSTVEV